MSAEFQREIHRAAISFQIPMRGNEWLNYEPETPSLGGFKSP